MQVIHFYWMIWPVIGKKKNLQILPMDEKVSGPLAWNINRTWLASEVLLVQDGLCV